MYLRLVCACLCMLLSAACQNVITDPGTRPVFDQFTSTPAAVPAGVPTTIMWKVTGAVRCVADEGWSGDRPFSGAERVTPDSTTTYSLRCSNFAGEVVAKTTVVVRD
jgi:hypothetical protein